MTVKQFKSGVPFKVKNNGLESDDIYRYDGRVLTKIISMPSVNNEPIYDFFSIIDEFCESHRYFTVSTKFMHTSINLVILLKFCNPVNV